MTGFVNLVLRVEKKMYVIEQPISHATAADFVTNVLAKRNAVYDAHNEDLSVGLIMNGLTSDFAIFVRNYNMHNMGKTIGELHALLIKYEKGLPKTAETPQGMAIRSGKIQKASKKLLNAKGKGKRKGNGKDKSYIRKPKKLNLLLKEHMEKDDTCRHYREVGYCKRNSPAYLYELIKKKKQVGTASSSDIFFVRMMFFFNAIPCDGIYETDMHDLVPNVNSSYNVSNKRSKHNLDSTYLWHCRLAHISTMTKKPFPHHTERATDLLGILHTGVCGPLRHVSRHGASYFITFTDDYSHYGYVYLLKHKHEVFETFKEKSYVVRHGLIYDESYNSVVILLGLCSRVCNTHSQYVPTKKVDKTPYELWSKRTHQAPNRLYLNVEAEEHSLGDLNEPTSYKDAMLDPESKKWLDAMNAKMQSMIDNMVWVLVDLSPNCKTVRSKWIYKKKTDMDDIVHTYKAGLLGKGYTQTFMVDYEETFSPVPNIRAIRILISIAAEATFILGIKIYKDRSKRLIGLGQNAYMDKILKRYKIDNSKRGHNPMKERLNINKTQGASTPKEMKRMQNVPYALVVVSIMYAVRCTRLGVAFAQNITSRYKQNPGEPHWTTAKNILKYLRNTKDMFLVYGRNPEAELLVDCYCNARFETDRDEIKSQTRYVFILNRRYNRLEKLQAKYYYNVRYKS
nr:retrotransposon protein, putative, Ty1-copia subclass [Tanacetum cinerariifolium]